MIYVIACNSYPPPPPPRSEIHSGTVVTYNDRQEILCQKCTEVALSEGGEQVTEGGGDGVRVGRGSSSDQQQSRSMERGERNVSRDIFIWHILSVRTYIALCNVVKVVISTCSFVIMPLVSFS